MRTNRAYALDFPPEQVQVYFFNDFAKDANSTDEIIMQALRFVGLEECNIEVAKEGNDTSIIKTLNEVVNEKRKGHDHPFIEELEKRGIPPEIEKQLRDFYRPYNKMLEELLGQKLPWN